MIRLPLIVGAAMLAASCSPPSYETAVYARWVNEPGPELLADCDTDAECAATPACRRDPTCDGGPVNGPRRAVVLVGVGCGKMREVMVAAEEDEFPRCDAIEAHYLPVELGR